MISLVIGLGNPGTQYANTRHNAGFWLVDSLANAFSTNFVRKEKFYAFVANITTDNGKMVLAKPDTFMNKSGISIWALASWHKLKPDQILIAHDDLDLPAGTARLKIGGGHGGHNGLRDIVHFFGSNDFIRLRIGIGHPGDKYKVLGYVLNDPSTDERIEIDAAISRAVQLLPDWQQGKWQRAMQLLHCP